MKHSIVRTQPVQPPVEKIVLELTPEEFLQVFRVMGHAGAGGGGKPTIQEVAHHDIPIKADCYPIYRGLLAAAAEIGIAR